MDHHHEIGIRTKATFLGIVLLILSSMSVVSAEKADIRHVLVLFPQDGWAVPAYRMVYDGMKSTFSGQSKYQVNLFSENLDLSFFSEESDQSRLVQFLRSKYARYPIDVVVPVTFPAMRFVQRYRESAFPGIPVVYCLLNVDDLDQLRSESGVTGVGLKLDVTDTIALIQRLHPGLKRLAVVAGTGPTDRYLVSLTHKAFESFTGQLEWIGLVGLPLEELLLRVSRLQASSAILYLTMQRDGKGNNFVSAEIQKLVSTSASVPLYNFIDSAFGYGSVGGRMVSIEANGRKAGELVVGVLDGKTTQSVDPVILQNNSFLFDGREMIRWGIEEGALPPDSIVRFRAPNSWMSYRGWIFGIISLFVFLTFLIVTLSLNLRRRKRMEFALTRSQDNLKHAQEMANIGCFRFDIQRDEVVWSMGVREIYGVPPDWKIDYAFYLSRVHSDDRELVDRSWKTALEGGGYDIEHRIVNAGQTRWVREKVDFDFSPDGKPISGTGVVLDISRQKKLETEFSTLHKELIHVSRLSVIGELGQSLAHEINQPLAAIYANAEAALQLSAGDPLDLPEIREALKDILADNKRAQGIIRRVRSLVKKTRHDRSLVDVNTVVRVAAKMVEGHARGRQVDIRLSLATAPTIVKADTIQLQQVVINFLVNAMEAIDAANNGKRLITVSTEKTDRGIIRLSISDSGVGIDPQTAERLYEPFFTTKKNGLGLGLAISRSIVESHGGSVTVESEPGRGTIFTVTLPAYEVPPAR